MGTATLELVWVMHGASLLRMLERAASGEDPEIIMLEEYANAEIDQEGD